MRRRVGSAITELVCCGEDLVPQRGGQLVGARDALDTVIRLTPT